MSKRLTTEEFIIKANNIHFYEYLYTDVIYKASHEKIVIECKKHGKFKQKPNDHLNKHGCPICKIENIKLKQKKDIDFYNKCNHDKYDYSNSQYINNRTKIEIKCRKHNIHFEQTPYGHIKGYNGCPECEIKSKGEDIIRKTLLLRNIEYKNEYIFKNCRNVKVLPFDFYLPLYNLCIEYDGKQHYKPTFSEKAFNELQINDNIKNKYCKECDIHLLRIPYWEIDNIEKIINKIL